MILRDVEFAASKGIENRLWDMHGRTNNRFRKELKYVCHLHLALVDAHVTNALDSSKRLEKESMSNSVKWRKNFWTLSSQRSDSTVDIYRGWRHVITVFDSLSLLPTI